MVVQSWVSEHTLEGLTKAHRNRELIRGVIRSVKDMKLPIPAENGEVKIREVPTLVVALPGGVTGYCPSPEFREHKFKSYARFVGTQDEFVVTRLDLENQVAFLSGIEATKQQVAELWKELAEREEDGTLLETEYKAVITSINQEKGVVHLRFRGQDAFMYRADWSWNTRTEIDADVGETIYVRVKRIDVENKMVRLSRKHTLPDPMDFLNQLRRGDIIAGKIVSVNPIHGIFVEVETGVVLKGTKPRSLEEPDIGDIVTLRVDNINPKKRVGRVILIDYPQGKRKKKDLGSFLFED